MDSRNSRNDPRSSNQLSGVRTVPGTPVHNSSNRPGMTSRTPSTGGGRTPMTPGTPGGRQTAPVSRQVSSGSGGASTGKTILFRIMTGVVISSFFL